MSVVNVIVLAVVQGLAELLPVSSSAHVIVAEKLLGLDPSSPPMTLLLVALHTGTMLAVIVYFWRQWGATYFQSAPAFKAAAVRVLIATAISGIVGVIIMKVIEKTLLHDAPHAEIEDLFRRLDFIAPALAAAGLLILVAGIFENRRLAQPKSETAILTTRQAAVIGLIQGFCLPFRGFSRSGATISAGILLGVPKLQAETFSFALAVALTPAVVGREVLRLVQFEPVDSGSDLASVIVLSVLGASVAFTTGVLALRWLSRWLESGRWYLFGIYCLIASIAIAFLHHAKY